MSLLPLVVALTLIANGQQEHILLAKKRAPTPGEWSANAIYLGFGLGGLDGVGEYRVARVPSPDLKKVILIADEKLQVNDVSGKPLSGSQVDFVPTLSEVLWSDDSSAFAITSSFGGFVGDWHVRVYMIQGNRLTKLNVTSLAEKDAVRRYRCDPSEPNEPPEIGAVAWQEGVNRLLVVAQVPPHSSCPDMGTLFGYVVSVPNGNILRRLSEIQLRTEFGSLLGERLAGRK